jgi:hypothetical protein
MIYLNRNAEKCYCACHQSLILPSDKICAINRAATPCTRYLHPDPISHWVVAAQFIAQCIRIHSFTRLTLAIGLAPAIKYSNCYIRSFFNHTEVDV